MRLFIAIDFDKDIKSYFEQIKTNLENYCIKGRFTYKENYHITLLFIGETEEYNVTKVLCTIRNSISEQYAFKLTLDSLASFKKCNVNLLWIATNYNENLEQIYKNLCHNFKYEGIAFDEKPLKPHITMGREIILKKEINELVNLINIEKKIIPVNSITLMESKRINNKLTYIPLDTFTLKH